MDSGTLAVNRESYWQIPPLWAGETAFLLGGGPSLTPDIAARVRNRKRIAINCSCALAPDADILLFTDNSWFEKHRRAVEDWRGLAVTLTHAPRRALPDKVLMPWGEMRGDFPRAGSGFIRLGRSTGHSAIGLAIALGTTTIVLLGYDMRVVEGQEHFHGEYLSPAKQRVPSPYETEFLPGFAGWNEQALAVGVRVLNATPESALTEFPSVNLDDC